jgi:GTPase
VTEVWSVPYTGVVVNGIINSGTITAGDPVMIGPDSVGGWINTVVKSIHRKRAPVPSAEAGQSVSFALKKMKKGVVRKGMATFLIGIKTNRSHHCFQVWWLSARQRRLQKSFVDLRVKF